AAKVAALADISAKYYVGPRIRNPQYAALLSSNDLIPCQTSATENNGLAALLNGTMGTLSAYSAAQAEQAKRKAAQEAAIQQAASIAATRTQLAFSIQNTADGHQGVFGTVRNVSPSVLSTIVINVYYVAKSGKVLYTETVRLDGQHLTV